MILKSQIVYLSLLYEKESFTAEQWKPIVIRMQKNTKLTDLQREKIYAYLTTPQF